MNINRRGLFGTLFIHGLILALLILGGLTFPDPPPEEEGIMVNFGTDDSGFGFIEPKGDDTNAGNPELEIAQNVPEAVEESQPEPAQAEPVYEEPLPADNTQDVEEAPIKEDPVPSAEELSQQREEADRIKKEREETERIRKAEEEAERIRKAEEERIRKAEEAERLRKLEEERVRQEKADRLNNMGQNAFGQQGVGDGDGSQGVTQGSGNQGVTTGSAGAPNYGDGQGLGDGMSFGLGGRNVLNKITPNLDKCSVTSRIIVTVEIKVDQQGVVISASVKSATFSDNCIYDAVVAAAKRTKFNSDANAAFQQTGWIRYTIEP